MRTYLVFEPADGVRDEEAAERVRFVREKFSWAALFFAPLWLLWHALWLGFFGWLSATMLISGVAYALDLNPSATAIILWLPSLVIAFEGTELRRRKLLRRGYRDARIAMGRNLEDAERRFFAEWSAFPRVRVERRAVDSNGPRMPQTQPIIGLFPEPGGGR
ncbi:MAG: DUF2628 domain-containing protein [Bradyrhizobiaceae bacterium]|nr:DUF2628 domain-containing protein [Bradyrhizobiaceae bacterium]